MGDELELVRTVPTVSDFLSAWPLFQDAVLAGLLAGAVLGLVGVYVVTSRMVFLAAALSETAGLGVALSCYAATVFGIGGLLGDHTGGALVATVLTALAATSTRSESGRDSLLGWLFLMGTAGALALSTRLVEDLHSMESLLFGSAVAVLPGDLQQISIVGIIVTVIHLWLRQGFIDITIDLVGSRIRGRPVVLLKVILILSISIMIATSTKVIGAMPVFAFSILPGIAALSVSYNLNVALVLAALVGAVSGFGGYFLAFRYRLPVGAAQALFAGCLVVFCRCTGWAWRVITFRMQAR